ncbi:restriction endonuclease subunit S, partial [Acinetobacter baumannii]
PKSSDKSFYQGNIPFIKSGEISQKVTEQYINEVALKNSSAKLVNKGDLLYALYGATSGQVAISQINGAINQAILCIRSDLNTRYLLN